MKNFLSLFALTLCLFLSSSVEMQAQDYKSAAGLRLGYPLALSYKTFISESSALEAYVGYRGYSFYNYISINGAYQIHKDISSIDGLQWYFGGGAGVQLYSYDGFDEGSTFFTVNGYLGLQYTFPDTPISVTADWVPGFAFGTGLGGFGGSGFGGGRGGLGVRYVLNRGGK